MLSVMSTAREHSTRLAILCLIAFVAINAVFYLLSGNYFDSHHKLVGGASVPSYSPDEAAHIRVVFAAVSGAIAAASFFARLSPRVVAPVLAALLGVTNVGFGVAALLSHLSGALAATLLVAGILMPVLAWSSHRRSRAAWAFLGTMCGVLAFFSLFFAPKLRGMLDISMWTAMILPGLYVVAAAAFFLLRNDYVDRGPAPASGALPAR